MTESPPLARTPEEWDGLVAGAQRDLDVASNHLRNVRAAREAARLALLPPNPFKIGDKVHIYANSREAWEVVKVNPRSVVATCVPWPSRMHERVPIHRVRPVNPNRVGG